MHNTDPPVVPRAAPKPWGAAFSSNQPPLQSSKAAQHVHRLPPGTATSPRGCLAVTVPKEWIDQMPWDASSSFPRLISGGSPHITSCPLCMSLTTFLPPALFLSSSHDPSLSPFCPAKLHPIPQFDFPSLDTPTYLMLTQLALLLEIW